ncbi:MAG: cytochrome c oxidase subunit II [Bacteroidota bacterium]
MFEVIIAIGTLLLLIILFTLFRIGRLVNVVKGKDRKVVGTSNKVNAAMMMIFMIGSFAMFFWYSFTYYDDYTLPVASEHGIVTDGLFWITTAVTGIVFVITNVLLFYFSFQYQHKDGAKAKFYPDNTKLELLWTVVPAIVLSVLVFTGLKAWNDITSEATAEAEVIEIMGYQFAWKVRYPGVNDNQLGNYDYRLTNDAEGNEFGIDFTDENSYDDFVLQEVHMPVGKEILFNIRARDVLHSVFAPHFRLKMDAVPGMPTHFKFTPTKTTQEMRDEVGDQEFDYFITCTEICGRGHFSMKMKVVVDTPEDYEIWKTEQLPVLKVYPDLLEKVPTDKKELAKIKAGIEKEKLEATL